MNARLNLPGVQAMQCVVEKGEEGLLNVVPKGLTYSRLVSQVVTTLAYVFGCKADAGMAQRLRKLVHS